VAFTFFLVIFAFGVWKNGFLWNVVRGLEFFGNWIGRFFAWAGLLMVIQQVVIVFMQRIFARPDIVIGFGLPVQFDVSWWSEELKLYNAMVVCLCLIYTFIQGGHVRVDLVYSAVSFRTKRMIDMVGSMIFMIPMAVITWMYVWFFMWRHLIVPKPSASDQVDRLVMKARALRWNVETIGFSPNGFNAYFLFKVLMVIMLGLIFIQAWTFFYRSYLEWVEGEESEGKYHDHDKLEAGEEPYDHAEF
jgi:TRAP-type mannitol/chloroaromatic compound transport system permease small subunit